METISKAKIGWLRSLQQKKHREAEQVFVAEGEKMVLEGIRSSAVQTVCIVVHSESTHLVADAKDVPVLIAGNKEMEQISAFKTPNKLLAVFRRPGFPGNQSGLTLALDSVQDPGNMGTLLRLADWFGIEEIVCSRETVDCFNPKVIQASMGAIFRISVRYTNLSSYLSGANVPVYGALLNGEQYTGIQYDRKGILLMGNEGNGISATLLPFISHPVTIPRIGQAESLNVATAAAILIAEMVR